jgi:HSP20 family protein
MAETQSSIARRDEQQVVRRTSTASPFQILDRFADEMDRMFNEFGFGRAWNRESSMDESITWAPRIDITQRNNEVVIRADLPGLEKGDVKVDVISRS